MNKTKFRNTKSKGQVALEFMMTYGWALLLVITLVAGLAYIMPHPQNFAANKCVFGSAIPCLGAQLNSSELTVVLRNGLGQTIYNFSAYETMPTNMQCESSNSTVRPEERIVIICNNSGVSGMNLDSDSRIRVELTYKKVKNGYNQSIIGEIYVKYT